MQTDEKKKKNILKIEKLEVVGKVKRRDEKRKSRGKDMHGKD